MTGSDRTEQFVQLITQYQQRVHLFILSLVPNRADAEEILQETNLVLWRKFNEFRPGSDFRAWAFQVAYNKVKSFRERHGRERLRFSECVMERLATVAAASPENIPAILDILQSCKEELSRQDLDLIERRYEPGATTASVAKAVGRSAAAVYKAVGRIRRTLYECVQRASRREERE
ncbi:MAG: sigma-70 family RNA polymerase sigma factor [Pirellulaceae bacterium]|nr:sigma-70 family RNA polymerase sigma factor [Pirellulaceae bacterium]